MNRFFPLLWIFPVCHCAHS